MSTTGAPVPTPEHGPCSFSSPGQGHQPRSRPLPASTPQLQHWGEAVLSLSTTNIPRLNPQLVLLAGFASKEGSCSSQHSHTTGLLTPANPRAGCAPHGCASCSSACSIHPVLLNGPRSCSWGWLCHGLSPPLGLIAFLTSLMQFCQPGASRHKPAPAWLPPAPRRL